MKIKRWIVQTGVIAGVILGMKYIFPVMLPFLMGWLLAEAVHPLARYMADRKWSRRLHIKESGFGAFFYPGFLRFWELGLLLLGTEYLTGKDRGMCKILPSDKGGGGRNWRGRCCQGVERIMGIPAEESRGVYFPAG